MKKLYFLLAIFLTVIGHSQIINIPDSNFKAALLGANFENGAASDQFYNTIIIDANSDNEIEVSEALNVYNLRISYANIADITGLSYFTNLAFLDCGHNQINTLTLDAFPNLTSLYCSYNQLTSLTVADKPAFTTLDCSYNQLTNISLTNLPQLINVSCNNNSLSEIVINAPNLHSLLCDYNQLQNLDVSQYTNLATLSFMHNQISTINLTGLNLQYLACDNNQLTVLNVTGLLNLQQIFCYNNQLSSLDLHGLTNLTLLTCGHNQLTALDLNGLNALQYLSCESNSLATLDVSMLPNIHEIYCYFNVLTSLNVGQAPNLINFDCTYNLLTNLDLNGATGLNTLHCGSNPLLQTLFIKNGHFETYFDFYNGADNSLYICADASEIANIQSRINMMNLTNVHVNSYCSFTPGGGFYSITGDVRYDIDGNGCDAGDVLYPNIKFIIDNGSVSGSVIADASGNCDLSVSDGSYTITPILEHSNYFNISPPVINVTFPGTASPFNSHFCLTPSNQYDDLEIAIIPINRPRPGFSSEYKIICKNTGTTVQNGTVNFSYDDNHSDLLSANPMFTSQGINSLSWSFTGLAPFETREMLVTLSLNSPLHPTYPLNDGDYLNFSAFVFGSGSDENLNDNITSLHQLVKNSWDPNDKTCIEGATVESNMIGEYVHYLIRFENTGTANAENIVVKDIIDTTKFDMSTLIPLSGSAPYITRINNTNEVEFIFENIDLPFDDANNDGYVAFKIKTKPTLLVGDTFSNSADIYFDYNFPIVTNAATTTITALSTQDFDFNSLFTLSPVPPKNELTITNRQNITISSASIYNMLGQLIQVNTNPNETIDVSGLKTGSYFIKILSDKGTVGSKFVKQ